MSDSRDMTEDLLAYDKRRAALEGVRELLEELGHRLLRAGMSPYSQIQLGIWYDPADLEALRAEIDGSRGVSKYPDDPERGPYQIRYITATRGGAQCQAQGGAEPLAQPTADEERAAC